MALSLYKDGETKFSVTSLAATRKVRSNRDWILRKDNPFHFMDAGNESEADLVVLEDMTGVSIFDGNDWQYVVNRGEIKFHPVALNDGTFSQYDVGADIYVYICIDGASPEIVCSANSTYPSSSTAYTSRRIGKFHYGVGRKVSDDGSYAPVGVDGEIFGLYWQSNVYTGILPNCIQDLVNRPVADFGAMCQIGPHGHGWWACKYQLSSPDIPPTGYSTCWDASSTSADAVNASGGEQGIGSVQSVYGRIPLTGTQGLCAYNFGTLLGRKGCRLPTWSEWISMAYGSPNGNNVDWETSDGTPCASNVTGAITVHNKYAWSWTSNTAVQRTGAGVNPLSGVYDPDGDSDSSGTVKNATKPYAVSAWNLDDCVGNVWEWTDGYGGGGNDAWCEFGGCYDTGAVNDRLLGRTLPTSVEIRAGARAVCSSVSKI